MPRLTWLEFVDLHKKGHLLIAVLPEEGPPGNVREHVNLLTRLFTRQAKGYYALTVNRHHERPEIHCAFERETDAETIGDGLAAELRSGNREWTTQRRFKMDSAAPKTMRDVLDEG